MRRPLCETHHRLADGPLPEQTESRGSSSFEVVNLVGLRFCHLGVSRFSQQIECAPHEVPWRIRALLRPR